MINQTYIKTFFILEDAYLYLDEVLRQNSHLNLLEATLTKIGPRWRVGVVLGSGQYEFDYPDDGA